ncbi:hypothetical protein [Thalassospira sp.]|uniref:hypothetical protein n=1 Tax=Thalassospira sp. TaxID=1912094 RepID=UPI0025CD0599|nr:hypothetical protein [Thalassospira sp.]
MTIENPLFRPLELPSGVILKNRIAKSAMSDSLGDGTGHPTKVQNRLYRHWAEGALRFQLSAKCRGILDMRKSPAILCLMRRLIWSGFVPLHGKDR